MPLWILRCKTRFYKDIPALFDIEVDVDSASNNNATLVFMHPRVRALLSALGRKDYESALFWSGFHKDSQTKPSYAYLNTAHILLTHHIRNIKDDKRLWFNIFRFRDSKKMGRHKWCNTCLNLV